MNIQEKLLILAESLNKHGLSINDAEVVKFLEEKKQLAPLSSEEADIYGYSNFIKPVVMSVLPTDIENATYAETFKLETITDWYLYKNSSDNPFVFNNLESDYKSIKKGFEKAKESTDFLKMSPNGKLFNEGDGNHRLLTLKLKHFIEKASAKTLKEKNAVDEKYKMNLKVSFPISKELSELLSNERLKISPYFKNREYSKLACEYRQDVFAKAKQNDYMCEFNPKTKTLKYSFNGHVFEGNDKDLCSYLKSKKQTLLPIMTYSCNNSYYVSCYNMVWKTNDAKKINAFIPKIIDLYAEKKLEEKEYLQVYDIDLQQEKNAYSIKFPNVFIDQDNAAKAREVAQELKNILALDSSKIIGNENLEKLTKQCEEAKFWGQIDIYGLEYNNVSKEDYTKLTNVFNQISNIVYKERENNLENS